MSDVRKRKGVIVFLLCVACVFVKSEVRAATYDKAFVQDFHVESNGTVRLTISEESQNYYYGETLGNMYDDVDYDDDKDEYNYVKPETHKYIDIYRSGNQYDSYQLIGSMENVNGESTWKYEDAATLLGNTYYYKICCRTVSGEEVSSGEFSNATKVIVIPSPAAIVSVRATKAKTFTIKWKSATNIDGYDLYVKEFDNSYVGGLHQYSQYEIDGLNNNDVLDAVNKIPLKKIASVSASKSSYSYKKAKHGKGYIFAIKSYKSINGKKVVSNVMYCAHGVMDYYYCENAENKKFSFNWPKNEKQAEKLMTTIKVKTWDYKNHAAHKGAKKTRYQWITVNKKYAATIKEIYKEIYKSKKKPPIYEAGSYRWRTEESTWSYHTVGTAIDMNCNENPYYTYNAKGKRVISVGSFYKPKKNGYSIPRNGVIEKTFLKYGFYRLENDLMHFNTDGYVYSSSNY